MSEADWTAGRPSASDIFGALSPINGVTAATARAFAKVGVVPEPDSPLHLLMACYDDSHEPAVREGILFAARQINALTPFACCAMRDVP